jgi:hypothetical protein
MIWMKELKLSSCRKIITLMCNSVIDMYMKSDKYAYNFEQVLNAVSGSSNILLILWKFWYTIHKHKFKYLHHIMDNTCFCFGWILIKPLIIKS